MRLHDITWQPVISKADAAELGRVSSVVVDPSRHRVRAYRIADTTKVLAIEAASGVGPDAIMVEDHDLREPEDDIERHAVEDDLPVFGARVLTDQGDELGTLVDLDFDDRTGEIGTLSVGGQSVPGDRIRGIGRYAIVVRAAEVAPDR